MLFIETKRRAADLWNALPGEILLLQELPTFKTNLKLIFFRLELDDDERPF